MNTSIHNPKKIYIRKLSTCHVIYFDDRTGSTVDIYVDDLNTFMVKLLAEVVAMNEMEENKVA